MLNSLFPAVPSRRRGGLAGLAALALVALPASAMEKLIVRNAVVVTVEPGQDPYHGYLVVGADGRIADLIVKKTYAEMAGETKK